MLTRRRLGVTVRPFPPALALAATLALAGCGAPAPPPPAPPVADAAQVAALPEGRGAVTANPDGTRTVTSSYGTTVVPADPQRIVSVIGDTDLDALVALGVPVVGAGTQGGTATDGFAPHLADGLAGAAPLAWTDGVPVEAVAALAPDLVFVPDRETFDALSAVAPVVPRGSWLPEQWREDFRYVADVLGRGAEADTVLERHDVRAAALRERVRAEWGDPTVASPQVSHDSSGVSVDPADAFSSVLLTELGLRLHPLAAGARGEGASVSFETLPRIDADVLFWQVRQADDGSPDTAALALATGSPLWSRLPAVRAGRVHEVVNRPWYFPGPRAAQVVLDDVERALDRT